MMLAAVLILKNEEAMIRRCIESLRYVDEIVCAVDSTTHDKTREILQEMSASFPIKWKEQKWPGGFAAARNDALEMTDCEWRLNIDADEVLAEDGAAAIRKVMNTRLNAINARMQWKDSHFHHFPRVIRRGVKYEGIAHEAPAAGPAEPSDAVIWCERSPAHDLDPDRALKLLAVAHVEEPQNARTLYYLAREYWYRERFNMALPLFKKCIELSKFAAERADAHLYMARMLWKLNRGNEAREECLMAIGTNANFTEALLFMAEMSNPKNKSAWERFALKATDEDVLFVRGKTP